MVQVAAGSYPIQYVPTGHQGGHVPRRVGNKILQLDNSADNVTFDGLDVDAQGTATGNAAVFENHDGNNVTFKNSRIGNVTDRQTADGLGHERRRSTT